MVFFISDGCLYGGRWVDRLGVGDKRRAVGWIIFRGGRAIAGLGNGRRFVAIEAAGKVQRRPFVESCCGGHSRRLEANKTKRGHDWVVGLRQLFGSRRGRKQVGRRQGCGETKFRHRGLFVLGTDDAAGVARFEQYIRPRLFPSGRRRDVGGGFCFVPRVAG